MGLTQSYGDKLALALCLFGFIPQRTIECEKTKVCQSWMCELSARHMKFALCISWDSTRADHTTGVQVQTHSEVVICLWGVKQVINHWCQPRENRFTARYLTSDSCMHHHSLPSVLSRESINHRLIFGLFADKCRESWRSVCLHHCGLSSVFCTHKCGQQVLISQAERL